MMSTIKLGAEDLRILKYIQDGHDIMSELFDLTSWPGEKVNHVIEKLDENRFIERAGLTGAKFWSFSLTEKGTKQLTQLNEQEKSLRQRGLCAYDIETLRVVYAKGKSIATVLIASTVSGKDAQLQMAGSVVKLIRRGYLKESGFLKRIIEITPKGKSML